MFTVRVYEEEQMNQIADIRKSVGKSQADLATAIGWNTSRIGNYELGIRTPKLNECREIVSGLNKIGANCTLDDVFPPQQKTA